MILFANPQRDHSHKIYVPIISSLHSPFYFFLVIIISWKSEYLFPGGGCSQAPSSPVSSSANYRCVPECVRMWMPRRPKCPPIPSSLKTRFHSSYSLIFPTARMSLQRLITAIYQHCKKCPSQQVIQVKSIKSSAESNRIRNILHRLNDTYDLI